MKRSIIVLLLLTLIFCLIPTALASSTVATSSSPTAIRESTQTKTFYANGRFWIFYTNGTYMMYTTSTNGTNWETPQAIRSCDDGWKFSVYFDGTYMHYALSVCDYVADTTTGIYYRRGIPNANGTITWSTNEQSVLGSNNDFAWTYITVTADSYGYPWISYCDQWYEYSPRITKSSANNGTWINTTGFPYGLGDYSHTCVKLIPLTAGKVYVLYSCYYSNYEEGDRLKGKLWNGTAWQSEETPTNTRIFRRDNTGTSGSYGFAAVADRDDIHLIFLSHPTQSIIYLKRTYGSGWGNESLVQSAASSATRISATIDGNKQLYCFWAGYPLVNHMYYKRLISGTWESTPVDWFQDANFSGCPIQTYTSSERKIGVTYMKGTSNPYTIRFAYLDVNIIPTIGEFAAPSTVQANTWFYINATVRDGDGASYLVNATLELPESIILKWTAAGDTFSIYTDPTGYVTLNASESFKTILNSTAYKLSWKIKISAGYRSGENNHVLFGTKVYDSEGASSYNVKAKLFTFQGGQGGGGGTMYGGTAPTPTVTVTETVTTTPPPPTISLPTLPFAPQLPAAALPSFQYPVIPFPPEYIEFAWILIILIILTAGIYRWYQSKKGEEIPTWKKHMPSIPSWRAPKSSKTKWKVAKKPKVKWERPK